MMMMKKREKKIKGRSVWMEGRVICQVQQTVPRFWMVGLYKGLERMPGDHMRAVTTRHNSVASTRT